MDLKGCRHFWHCVFEAPKCLVGVSLPDTLALDHESTKRCRLDIYEYNILPEASRCLLREEFTDDDHALESERQEVAEAKRVIDMDIWDSIQDAAKDANHYRGEVKCLHCGGRVVWQRSSYNRHLSAACEFGCFFCIE